jgi:hypothetical protein
MYAQLGTDDNEGIEFEGISRLEISRLEGLEKNGAVNVTLPLMASKAQARIDAVKKKQKDFFDFDVFIQDIEVENEFPAVTNVGPGVACFGEGNFCCVCVCVSIVFAPHGPL